MNQAGLKCNTNICSNNAVPPSPVVHACLGPSLAQLFFDYTHHDTTKLLNILTPPKVSKTCFARSNGGQIADSALISPTYNEAVKAFVHKNILEIGENLFEKKRKEIEESLRDKVERQSREKFYMYQARQRWELEQQAKEMYKERQRYIQAILYDIQKQLEAEWSKAAVECGKNTQKAMVKERVRVVNEMMWKMRGEMTHVVESLYNEFEESFLAQRDNIIADFNQIMRAKHLKLNKEMHEYKQKILADFHVQRRQFEMQNAADIMYILCLERIRSSREKHTIHKYFQEQIEEFQKLLVYLHDIISIMRKEIIDYHVENLLLKEELCDISTQYQKFINFVFYAVPGQADYLLPSQLQRLITSDEKEQENSEK